ncbi:MAG: hypothetical protein ACUZ8E_17735 [Candidatus Anammoxibacter sp.]
MMDKFTRLYDKFGEPIDVGCIVHWTDGGDELSLSERVKSRWDRIAVVSMDGILPQFTVIDSPSEKTRVSAHTFCYGSFIWKDTEKYLTIVAKNKEEYQQKFSSAGDCMAWVLKQGKLI